MTQPTPEFVLVYCQRVNHNNHEGPIEVLFIEKNRPAWQAGRVNLIGGRIEEGESPEDAAIRELKEETGLDNKFAPRLCGTMGDGMFKIHVFEIFVNEPFSKLAPRDGETEVPFWASWGDMKEDRRLLPNLRVIVPLCMCGVEGWVIRDDARSLDSASHSLEVTVPTGY